MKDITPLCIAIVDALLVFETSSESEIDPDTAIKAMESISSSLHSLDSEDRRELRGMFERIAMQSSDPRYASFVQSVPDMLGLGE